jgi:cysteine desulfurase
MIYLDNNATTAMAAEVNLAMQEFANLPLNSAAIHKYGQKAQMQSHKSKLAIGNLLNASQYQITFTSGATEANNIIISGAVRAFNVKKIFCATIEHDAVYKTAHNITNNGKDQVVIEDIIVDSNGIIDTNSLINQIESFVENETALGNTKPSFLVLAMLVNNETGAIQPIKEIAKITHQYGGIIHSDIVQAIGKIPVDLEMLNIDFASISAHKFYGPQGIGAIITRKGLDFEPLFFGGGQENFKRPGTQNQLAIIGFGVAVDCAKDSLAKMPSILNLRNYFEQELANIIHPSELQIFSQDVARINNTSYLAIANFNSQNLVVACDLVNIAISSGAACSSGSVANSRILKAMKVADKFINSAIRISLGYQNTKEDLQKLLKELAIIINRKSYQSKLLQND